MTRDDNGWDFKIVMMMRVLRLHVWAFLAKIHPLTKHIWLSAFLLLGLETTNFAICWEMVVAWILGIH